MLAGTPHARLASPGDLAANRSCLSSARTIAARGSTALAGVPAALRTRPRELRRLCASTPSIACNGRAASYTARGGPTWTWDDGFAHDLVARRQPCGRVERLEPEELAWLRAIARRRAATGTHPAEQLGDPVLPRRRADGQGQVLIDGSHRAAARARAGLPRVRTCLPTRRRDGHRDRAAAPWNWSARRCGPEACCLTTLSSEAAAGDELAIDDNRDTTPADAWVAPQIVITGPQTSRTADRRAAANWVADTALSEPLDATPVARTVKLRSGVATSGRRLQGAARGGRWVGRRRSGCRARRVAGGLARHRVGRAARPRRRRRGRSPSG